MPNLNLKLRPTTIGDLDLLFEFQLDKEASYLAAFTPPNQTDKAMYLTKHTKFLSEPAINNQTILLDDEVVGSIAKFLMDGHDELTYWLDKKFWGRGVATLALQQFLAIEPARPIFGRVAFDNIGSQKVLTNNGFLKIGTDKGFANARQAETEEFIYKLEG